MDKLALLDEVNSDLQDYIDNVMEDSDTEFELEESFENELDSDDEPLNLLVPEANYHFIKNTIIEKSLEESSSKAAKEVKGKINEKDKGIEKVKGKGKDKGKSKGKNKEKEIKPVEIKFDWRKNMLHMQRKNVV